MKIFRAKKDNNHKEVKARYIKAGFSVMDCSMPDPNETEKVDLVVGYGGITDLVEIKGASKRLTDGEKKVFENWKGGDVWLVTNAVDQKVHIQDMKRRAGK